MNAAAVLAAGGIVDPPTVIATAAAVGLPVALAAALLEQESGGGRNCYGHDGGPNVRTGGAYIPGGPVTEMNYRRYRLLADARVIIRQGVGPCQLTAKYWQDAADRRGGCWRPDANMAAGFSGLVSLVNRYGLPDGIRRYNGSGVDAETYRDEVLTRYREWTTRLAAAEGDDDVAWTHDAGAPAVPDFYKGSGATLPDPLLALAWATTHAAFARDLAQQANRKIDALAADVAALRAQLSKP